MMEWEESYIRASIEALHPKGEVLEVGFGSGHAAKHIQSFQPIKHTIIESNSHIAGLAKEWAKDFSTISIIQDTWKNALSGLGLFDAIFFNESSLQSQSEGIQFLEMAGIDFQKGQEILHIMEQKLSHFANVRFSEKDFDDFYQAIGQFNVSEIPQFLAGLKQNGQISDETYENIYQKYPSIKKHIFNKGFFSFGKNIDPLFKFLEECLNHHMSLGSRFSCLSPTPVSKFENPYFLEYIITNPHLSYEEEVIPITVPAICDYYKYDTALVMTVEKQI